MPLKAESIRFFVYTTAQAGQQSTDRVYSCAGSAHTKIRPGRGMEKCDDIAAKRYFNSAAIYADGWIATTDPRFVPEGQGHIWLCPRCAQTEGKRLDPRFVRREPKK